MNEEEKAVLEQQRQRRNRITRMKNVVIMVVAGCFISCHYYPYSTSDLFKSPDRQTDSSK